MKFWDELARLILHVLETLAHRRETLHLAEADLRLSIGEKLLDQTFIKFARSPMNSSTCSRTHGRSW